MADLVVEAIWKEIERLGSIRAVANAHALDYSHLVKVAGGRRRPGVRLRRIFTLNGKPRSKPRITDAAGIRKLLQEELVDFQLSRILAREIGINESYLRAIVNGRE
jgi:hypothetical protein